MHRPVRSLILAALPVAAGVAVLSAGGWTAPAPTDRSAAVSTTADPDYWTDIRPLLLQRCMGCHGPEGPGWSMADPEETWERHRMIAMMVTQRRMPPWIAEAGHQEYQGDLSLPDAEIDLIRQWQEAGFPKGSPPARGDVPVPDGTDSNEGHGPAGAPVPFEPDLSLDVLPEGPFLPNQDAPDDYRCFVVDWPEAERRFVTGFRAAPGNLQVAHHVVIHAVDPSLADRFRELDDMEDGTGYQCFGGAVPDRLGIRAERAAYEARYPNGVRELNAGNFWLAHWAPGMDGHVFPEGSGIPVAPGSVMVVQMHYYGRDAPGQADADTRIEFQLADRVERPAFHLPQTRSDWLGAERNGSMVIEPGQTATFQVSDPLESLLPYIVRITGVSEEAVQALEIHSANLHMHAFGHSGQITLRHPSGQKETLLSVPRWDLRWQRDFTFAEPKVFQRDELSDVTLATECTFHNPTEDTVYGGYGSYDEMCFNFSYIAVRADEAPEVTDAGRR